MDIIAHSRIPSNGSTDGHPTLVPDTEQPSTCHTRDSNSAQHVEVKAFLQPYYKTFPSKPSFSLRPEFCFIDPKDATEDTNCSVSSSSMSEEEEVNLPRNSKLFEKLQHIDIDKPKSLLKKSSITSRSPTFSPDLRSTSPQADLESPDPNLVKLSPFTPVVDMNDDEAFLRLTSPDKFSIQAHKTYNIRPMIDEDAVLTPSFKFKLPNKHKSHFSGKLSIKVARIDSLNVGQELKSILRNTKEKVMPVSQPVLPSSPIRNKQVKSVRFDNHPTLIYVEPYLDKPAHPFVILEEVSLDKFHRKKKKQ